MTINYIPGHISQTATVYYDTISQNGEPSSYRYKAQGKIRTYPGVDFKVHSTHLVNLAPDQTYYFIVGDKTTGYSNERKFRTVPVEDNIRFITGGDASVSETFEKICNIAAKSNPHFAIIGGDIAYADGDISSQHLWLELLNIWQRTMITPDGHTIPIIAAIGNHDVNSSTNFNTKAPIQSLRDTAPFYHMFFNPSPGKTFFKRKIGKNTILFVLDTDHVYSSDGEQLEWMYKNFAQHKNDKFRFSSYHVPLYPSFYDPDATASVTLRNNWLKIFDQYQLHVAFENHEHTLKKSKPLKNHQVVATKGTIYIGDGNWGVVSRQPAERWYLEAARPVNHVWSVTLNEHTALFKALTVDGVDNNYTFEIKALNNITTQ